MGSRALWYLTFDSFDKNNQGRGGSEKEKTKASSPTINDNEVILIKNTRIRLIALFCWWWGGCLPGQHSLWASFYGAHAAQNFMGDQWMDAFCQF